MANHKVHIPFYIEHPFGWTDEVPGSDHQVVFPLGVRGAIVPAADVVSQYDAQLSHYWSFNDTLNDSVGSLNLSGIGTYMDAEHFGRALVRLASDPVDNTASLSASLSSVLVSAWCKVSFVADLGQRQGMVELSQNDVRIFCVYSGTGDTGYNIGYVAGNTKGTLFAPIENESVVHTLLYVASNYRLLAVNGLTVGIQNASWSPVGMYAISTHAKSLYPWIEPSNHWIAHMALWDDVTLDENDFPDLASALYNGGVGMIRDGSSWVSGEEA